MAQKKIKPGMSRYGFRFFGPDSLLEDSFEQDEIKLVSSLLPECDRFIDVGANVGLYACIARSRGIPVIAIEPLQSNLRLLLANLMENGWSDTEVIAAGLGSAAGIADLFGSGTGASLVPGWATLPENTLLRERIPLTTLDAVLGDRFVEERLLIKVDVEGAELDLLKGAVRTFSRPRAPLWLMEICLTENFPGGQNPNFAATFETFFAQGYRAETADAERRAVTRPDVEQWVRAGRAAFGSYNYLFVR